MYSILNIYVVSLIHQYYSSSCCNNTFYSRSRTLLIDDYSGMSITFNKIISICNKYKYSNHKAYKVR